MLSLTVWAWRRRKAGGGKGSLSYWINHEALYRAAPGFARVCLIWNPYHNKHKVIKFKKKEINYIRLHKFWLKPNTKNFGTRRWPLFNNTEHTDNKENTGNTVNTDNTDNRDNTDNTDKQIVQIIQIIQVIQILEKMKIM